MEPPNAFRKRSMCFSENRWVIGSSTGRLPRPVTLRRSAKCAGSHCGRICATGGARAAQCRWHRSFGSTVDAVRRRTPSARPPNARLRSASARSAAVLDRRIVLAWVAAGHWASHRPNAPAAAGCWHPANGLQSDTGRPAMRTRVRAAGNTKTLISWARRPSP